LLYSKGGNGRVVLVRGPAGIGKSRLLGEFVRGASREAEILWGQSWEAGGAPPYWVWAEALRPTLESRQAKNVRLRSTDAALMVATFLGGDVDRDPTQSPAEQARFRFFDTVAQHLQRMANQRPIVIVLEDISTADVSSITLLRFVAR